jgi:hypothetical protein
MMKPIDLVFLVHTPIANLVICILSSSSNLQPNILAEETFTKDMMLLVARGEGIFTSVKHMTGLEMG